MKLPNKHVIPYFIYGIAAVTICLLIALLLFNLPAAWNAVKYIIGILSPFIYGFAIAFIFNPVMNLLEYRLFGLIKTKKPHKKLWRVISLIITYIFALAVVSLILLFVTPEIIKSISSLISNLENYVNNLSDWIKSIFDNPNEYVQKFIDALPDVRKSIDKFLTETLTNITNLQSVFEFGKGLTSGILNFILGLIISIYILLDKDRFKARFKKLIYAVFHPDTTKKMNYWFSYTSQTFTKYISGKLFESLIIGLICFIFMTIFNWPYAVLISVVVAITNLIPFFGPFIGAIPSALILFVNNPWTALWFIIFIIALQQLDGNVIGPFILGDSVGLSAFWIIFSIVFFGGIFGIPGMFLGIPVFAVIYAIIKTLVDKHLEKNGLPTETSEYMTVNAVRYNKEYNGKQTKKKKIGNRLKEMLEMKSETQEPEKDEEKKEEK